MYLLIIGSPRSGTTLFASMISAHSNVAMLIEDKFFAVKKLTGKKVLANKLCIPHQIELSRRSNYFSRLFKKLGMSKNYTASGYNIKDYMHLPDSKILAIIRNGDDVISSIMSRGKKARRIAMHRWEKAIEIIYQLKKENTEKIDVVSYEALLKQPEQILRQVSDFLDIEFESQMLEGYKYNILYPDRTRIDASKAAKPDSNNYKYNFHPEVINKYNYLKENCIPA